MPKITYYNPAEGFSVGTKQGMKVCGVMLAILLGVVFLADVEGHTAEAVTCDVVAAILLSVLVVWVVGGLFEIEGKLADFAVKATGGAAIVFIAAFWIRPYYNLGPTPEFDVSIDFPQYEPLIDMSKTAPYTSPQQTSGGSSLIVCK